MSVVDEIYELIKTDNSVDAINNNRDLFMKFYYNEMSLYYGSDKVKEIYKYLLSVDVDEEIFPTLKDNIFDDFNRYETRITQAFYKGSFEVNDAVIAKLYELIELYNQFKVYDKSNRMIDINRFTRDYTGSMIIALNKGIFNIDKEYAKSMVDCVKNNIYIKNISENSSNGVMDRDYLFQYLTRFLFTSEFVNVDSMKDDILLNLLFNGDIKDKKIVLKMIQSIDLSIVLSNTDFDISSIIDVLDSVFDDSLEKKEIFNKILFKLENKNIERDLLYFMMHDERSKLYLLEDKQDEIIKKCALRYLNGITDEEARFLLDNCKDKLFLRNLKVDTSKKNNFSNETIKIINEYTSDIDIKDMSINEGLEVFRELFAGGSVNIDELLNAFSIFIKMVIDKDDIVVYFVKDTNYNGCTYTSLNAIALNIDKVLELLNEKDFENCSNKLWIIDTIFHELRHVIQFETLKEENIDDELYEIYKEDILVNYLNGYYDNNYIGVSFERDARIIGAQNTYMFLQKYFPSMINCIDYFKKQYEKELAKTSDNVSIFELSDEVSKGYAFDLLVALNPGIVSEHKQLLREYNIDGTRKKETEKIYGH